MFNKTIRNAIGGGLALLLISANTHAALTDLANVPLVSAANATVRPNIFFILDDSGSMDWDYLPDWANSGTAALKQNAGYNGVAYDPAITYTAPIKYTATGLLDTTTYPLMTSANTTSFTAVKNDGYNVQDTLTSNLVGAATFYTFIPGEYCDKENLRNCVTQAAPSATYPFPAKLRWCTTAALTSCQAVRIETGTTTYLNSRYPGKSLAAATTGTAAKATITFSGANTAVVTSVRLSAGGAIILAASTASTSTNSTVATRVAAQINACTAAATGSCTVSGYSAVASGSQVTITAPIGAGAVTTTPVVTRTGTLTSSITAFTGYVAPTAATFVPGSNLQTNIVSTNNIYPYPGTTAKASTRTDCAGTTCTYQEEMANYANWWAYYHTRMQMMKTAASTAFASIGGNYRVGFNTINGNRANDFLNIDTFTTAQKNAWYAKLFNANPNNSTPLRRALSLAGRLYAGGLNGASVGGSTVVDPVQYSCQQNFTILSTDGYWNEASPGGYREDGATAVGNADAGTPRPFTDGGTTTVTTVTPFTTVVQKQRSTPGNQTKPWTRTITSVGAIPCSAFRTPSATCLVDNGSNSASAARTWCISASNTGSQCVTVGSGGIYACRGVTNSTNLPPGGAACQVDSSGQQWCIYPNSVAGNSCAQVVAGNSLYYCKAGSGFPVTTQNQTYTETITGSTDVITNETTTRTDTVITTNGVSAPATSVTSGPVVTTVSNSFVASTTSGDPTVTPVTWSNSGAATTTCVSPAPVPGPSAPVAGAPTTANTGPVVTTTLSTVGPTPGVTTSTTVSGGGTGNTLADVAYYYYTKDLRNSCGAPDTGTICENNVPVSGLDAASWQHMTTFTLGLGASGFMQYSPSYTAQTAGDFFDVKNGTAANPASGVCSWQASGACNWPAPVGNSQTTIDDLWHAAVNGRGTYFSAGNPASLASGLGSALAGISARTGSSAAATTSNPNVTSGDNFVFSSTFTTTNWDGELVRQQLDLVTGVVSSTVDWSAQGQLDTLAAQTAGGGSRTIYTRDTGGVNGTKAFTWANLTAAEQAFFSTPNISTLSQYCAAGVTCLSAASKTAASGAPLVEFLRGDRTNEGAATDTTKYYRQRSHVLGDVVNGEAVYVKKSLFNYSDAGYTSFVSTTATRTGVVYVAGNDGMLHAFNASNGAESWAYVPSFVLPTMFNLADKNYANLHQYFVDGTPVVSDVFFGGTWHTILIGGQNGGGRGYYAIDITTEGTPKVLWEFTDNNLGLTFGNPEVTKLKDGTWVVLIASGYNNVAPGDGQGRLYVLNAGTGAIIRQITTGVGNTTTPSGLAKIRAWVDNATSDNTALRAYGGDLLGNVWRFDINGDIGAGGYDAQKLVQLVDASSNPQPITAKPELGEVSGKAVVFVGTGKYLGTSDLTDTSRQSFYAIKDKLDTTTLVNPRAGGSGFVLQVESNTTCPATAPATICSAGQIVRTSSSNTVNFATDNGWYLDLPDTGERANTDPTLALGTLAFNTNIPNASACTVGGYSNAYFLDYRTGGAVSTAGGIVAARLGNALATRPVLVRLPNNTIVELTRMSDGTTLTRQVPIGAGPGTTRRISWREIVTD